MRRNTVLLWLLVVFVSGTIVGVSSHRFFTRENISQEDRRPSREQVRQEYLAKLRERVGTSDEQTAQIVVILDEARSASDARRQAMDAEMRAIQDQTREKIRAVLTPQQLSLYDAWREERRLEREKRERERQAKEMEKAR